MSTSSKRPGEAESAAPDAQAPARLIEDPGSSMALREDLRRAARATPAYDVAAGLVALKAAIAASGAAAGAGSAAAKAATSASSAQVGAAGAGAKAAAAGGLLKASLAGKVALGAGALAAAVAAAVAIDARTAPVSRPAPVPQAQSAPAHEPRPADRVLAPQPAPADVSPAELTPSVGPDVEPSARASEAGGEHAVAPHAHAPRAASDHAAREVAQLARIKAALGHEPRRALELAEQGHREFRDGFLHHEREGLAIVALDALGEHAHARTRARAFVRRYPHGPMSERVRGLLAEDAQ